MATVFVAGAPSRDPVRAYRLQGKTPGAFVGRRTPANEDSDVKAMCGCLYWLGREGRGRCRCAPSQGPGSNGPDWPQSDLPADPSAADCRKPPS